MVEYGANYKRYCITFNIYIKPSRIATCLFVFRKCSKESRNANVDVTDLSSAQGENKKSSESTTENDIRCLIIRGLVSPIYVQNELSRERIRTVGHKNISYPLFHVFYFKKRYEK